MPYFAQIRSKAEAEEKKTNRHLSRRLVRRSLGEVGSLGGGGTCRAVALAEAEGHSAVSALEIARGQTVSTPLLPPNAERQTPNANRDVSEKLPGLIALSV
jgi:hypothetical protein